MTLRTNHQNSIPQNLSDINGDVMMGTNQNFTYLDIERHPKTRDPLLFVRDFSQQWNYQRVLLTI